jgi:hypothetical protein
MKREQKDKLSETTVFPIDASRLDKLRLRRLTPCVVCIQECMCV